MSETTQTNQTNATAVTPPATSVVIPDNWKDALPDDIRNDPSIQTIHTIPDAMKTLVHSQKLVGRDKVVILDKFATEEDKMAQAKKLGLPESLDKYELKLPEEVAADADFVKEFKELAYKKRVMPDAAEEIIGHLAASGKKKAAAAEAKRAADATAELDAYKKEEGQAYDGKVALARKVIKELGDEKTVARLNSTGWGNDPVLIRLLAKVGEQLQDDSVKGTEPFQRGLSPNEALQKRNSIYGDIKHPFFDKKHPNHVAAVDEVKKLSAIAFPEE